MKKLLQRRQGFTLIELLIVIVIIGILSVGFAPTLLNAPKKARDGVRKGQIASIQQAVEAAALDKNSVYPAYAAVTCIDKVTEIAPYFQGSTLPKDPSSNVSDCSGTEKYGFYYKNDTASGKSYYAIYTILEEKGKGNYADPTKIAYDSDLSKTVGDYFVVIQKN